MGLVPSFDGEFWRLHKGEKAEVVLEIHWDILPYIMGVN
jgi:hypothetical protein